MRSLPSLGLGKAFEDWSPSRQGAGTGCGMSILRRIEFKAHTHDGMTRARSSQDFPARVYLMGYWKKVIFMRTWKVPGSGH